ncbi:MAG: excinuclease ABC subunit UvrC [Spirochaetaceae bacterium]|jgi:excinuclease ABC subunit C|nr:excinuclease ABC subunit UvrC [Spirochaetaceae bacterium]
MNNAGFSENYSALKAIAADAPLEPGVYLWFGHENRIIYVGKAKSLRHRLRSYFSGAPDPKTGVLLKYSQRIETIITPSEYDALLLENTLIKQHTPKYNIDLKDGKTYPVIRITSEAFPRVFKTRHIVRDNSSYFGPFPDSAAASALLDLIYRLFPLRTCRVLRKRAAPCIYYHIKRCAAPCCGRISGGEYRKHILRIQRLLEGETSALVMELTERMHHEARAMRFERAAGIRDAIKAVESLSETGLAVDFDPQGRDYIAWASQGVLATFTVFSMRGGKLVGRDLFRACSAAGEEESFETFAAAYYTQSRLPPEAIYLPAHFSSPALGRWFLERFGYEPRLLVPHEKRHAAALAMARQNALEDLRLRLKERGAGPALDDLARILHLAARPERIEGFDISQLDGKHPVASLVSFKDGIPDRKNYRHFKLKTVAGVVDDVAAMREAVRRRYARLLAEGADLPDLVLVDGGAGQANAAKGEIESLGLAIGVAGLAKRDEEIWLPGVAAPIQLSRRSEALKVLQLLRDEAHRFATGLNQRLRSKDIAFALLEGVGGIRRKQAETLMKAFGGLEKIASADLADLMSRAGLSRAAAEAVQEAARRRVEARPSLQERRAAGIGESLADQALLN